VAKAKDAPTSGSPDEVLANVPMAEMSARAWDRGAHSDRDPEWTVLHDAMVGCGQDAWCMLRAEDKAQVRSWHESLMRHCCSMPPGNTRGDHG